MRNSFARKLLVAAVTLTAIGTGGCAREIGRDFDPDQADRLTVGSSTLSDAVVLLGEPFRVYRYFGGMIAKWWYLRDVSGMTEAVLLEIKFGADGKMLRVIREIEERVPEPPSSARDPPIRVGS